MGLKTIIFSDGSMTFFGANRILKAVTPASLSHSCEEIPRKSYSAQPRRIVSRIASHCRR